MFRPVAILKDPTTKYRPKDGNHPKHIAAKLGKTCITELFEMIVGVLTTCHTQYTFYSIEQHSKFLLHTLQVLYMCTLCDSTNINTIIEFVPNCL